MPIVLRNSKNSALTHSELDGNFTDLDTRVNSKADSSTITSIVNAEYIQARQLDLQRDSAFVTNIVSETYVTNFIDSAYIQARQVDLDTQRDSAFVTNIVTTAYIQDRQNTYTDISVNNHLNTATATSGQVLSWTGADYDWINQTSGTGGGIDSAVVVDIISTQDINDLNHNLETLPVSAPGGFDQPVHGTIMVYDVDTTDGNMFRYQTVQGAVQNALNIDGNSTNKVLGWNGSTFIWKVDSVGGSGSGSGLDSAGIASYLNGGWDFHLIPDTNATYDIGSAEYKVRHLYLSDNSLYFDSGQTSIGFETVGTSKNLKFNNNVVKEASHIEEAAGLVDISKTNHFVTTGATYDLPNGEYVGQELKFWHKTQGGTNIVRVNVLNAKWRNGGGVLSTIPNMLWDQDKTNTACYGCIWDGEAWIIGEGSLGA